MSCSVAFSKFTFNYPYFSKSRRIPAVFDTSRFTEASNFIQQKLCLFSLRRQLSCCF